MPRSANHPYVQEEAGWELPIPAFLLLHDSITIMADWSLFLAGQKVVQLLLFLLDDFIDSGAFQLGNEFR